MENSKQQGACFKVKDITETWSRDWQGTKKVPGKSDLRNHEYPHAFKMRQAR